MTETIKQGYTRVSDVASCFAPYARIPKEILDNAAGRGDQIHNIIFDMLNDIPVEKDRLEWKGKSIQGYIDSFRRFWETLFDPKILMQEDRLYEDSNMITGKMDLLIYSRGEIIMIDWKTSSNPCAHWDIQAGGYQDLIENGYSDDNPKWHRPPEINKILFVHIKKDGEMADCIDHFDNVPLFRNALGMYTRYFKNSKFDLEDL